MKPGPMIAENAGFGIGGQSYWLYGAGLGGLGTADGPILADIFSSGHASPSVISVATASFRLVPGVIDAIHRSAAGCAGTGLSGWPPRPIGR